MVILYFSLGGTAMPALLTPCGSALLVPSSAQPTS